MTYYTALLLVFGGLGVSAVAVYLLLKLKEQERLHKIQKIPFDDKYKKILNKTPHYRHLSQEEKEKIQRSILLFTHTKEFVGVELQVSEEMKIVIAFYACLLVLHTRMKHCYDNLKTIIVYPNAVITKSVNSSGGIYTKEDFLIDGQSANDTVVIAWHDAKYEAYHLRHNNVVVHEFAHEIDFMDGEIDGVPPIEKAKYDEWVHILAKEYDALSKVAFKNRDWGKYKLLGAYAATNEAEFFAVTTERFFESPHALKREFPDLYNELKSFYNIDTLKLVDK